MVALTPVIVTARPSPLPFAIVTVVPLGTKSVDASLTETIVPAPPFTSGLADGKLVSLFTGTKPPTSSTRSIILSLIAAVVAIVVSLSGNVSPSLIVSPVLMLKNLASAAAEVKKDVSLVVAAACSLDVITVAAFNLAEVTEPSAILGSVTALSIILIVLIVSSTI